MTPNGTLRLPAARAGAGPWAMMGAMDSSASRTRRSPATVRLLVLRAARELFAEQGYAEASTREIARRAGVTQAQIFRHFDTKAGLFVEATYRPFRDFVAGYLNRWAQQGHGTESSARDTEIFVAGLYRLLLENRALLGAMSASAAGGPPELAAATAAFLREVFDRLEREVVLESVAKGDKTMDPGYAVRFAFALVFGVSVLDQALFPDGSDHELVIEEMSGYILRGASIPQV
jgi:AcrR family transcriptional regulator